MKVCLLVERRVHFSPERQGGHLFPVEKLPVESGSTWPSPGLRSMPGRDAKMPVPVAGQEVPNPSVADRKAFSGAL